jgi:hypothetical protein
MPWKHGIEELALNLLGVVVKFEFGPLVVTPLYEGIFSTALHLGPLDEVGSVL